MSCDTCTECGASLSGRSDSVTCSPRCRKRRSRREPAYVVTAEDRAAIRRAAELVPIPIPLPTHDEVLDHVARNAERT